MTVECLLSRREDLSSVPRARIGTEGVGQGAAVAVQTCNPSSRNTEPGGSVGLVGETALPT